MPVPRVLSATLVLAGLLAGCGDLLTPPVVPPPPPGNLPPLPASQVAWLKQALVPLSSTSPTDDLSDLEPLRAIIGDARIVALGESTHGTREFFTMKHRILRFLATEMGFTGFAIEATWPESNRVDRYVRTGVGSVDTLLSGLYFWTWNTTEVRDQIEWMRSFNAGGGSLGFYGFDMQSPGMALENLRRFILQVDPASEPQFTSDVACLQLYANNPQGRSPARYRDLPATYRLECGLKLLAARARFHDRRDSYIAASSAQEFEIAAHSIEIALQFHYTDHIFVRDSAMAENATWVLDHLGPSARIVLWAHNAHVRSAPGWMGQHLRQKYGTSYVRIGFAFGTGGFNAVPFSHALGGVTTGQVQAHTAQTIAPLSYEHYFSTAGVPHFLIDLRDRQAGADSAQWLAGPRLHRSVGATWDPAADHFYWVQRAFPADFDVMIYIHQTLPSTLLPFQYPTEF